MLLQKASFHSEIFTVWECDACSNKMTVGSQMKLCGRGTEMTCKVGCFSHAAGTFSKMQSGAVLNYWVLSSSFPPKLKCVWWWNPSVIHHCASLGLSLGSSMRGGISLASLLWKHFVQKQLVYSSEWPFGPFGVHLTRGKQFRPRTNKLVLIWGTFITGLIESHSLETSVSILGLLALGFYRRGKPEIKLYCKQEVFL